MAGFNLLQHSKVMLGENEVTSQVASPLAGLCGVFCEFSKALWVGQGKLVTSFLL